MPDRVKEAVFATLGSRLGTPGGLPPLRVADVFSGSGTLGLEALSRGASACYFFERHPRALAALRANIQKLEAGPGARIMPIDAWKDPWSAVDEKDKLAVLFVDPPYRDSRDASSSGKVSRLLAQAVRSGRLAPDAIAVLHHETRVEFVLDADVGWQSFDARRYGSNRITWFHRNPDASPPPAGPTGANEA
jgi:16S rRNA (guanine966-N2)-methyltransferase